MFRYYTNAVSQAPKGVAKGIVIVGLLLIGFGILILALPAVFAMLAAIIFFMAGLGCVSTAVKIFLANRRMNKFTSNKPNDYRENVRIHGED